MKYLLDTNICVHFFRGKYKLLSKFEEIGINNCAISEITLAELVFGAEKSQNPDINHIIINNFIEHIAVIPIYDSIY
jgi:tRNA(fMet)-specific endonuclease VapC